MDGLSQFNTMLQLLPQPAFRVENGIITHVNQAAAACCLQPGDSFPAMITSGRQEYEDFTDGTLYVTLTLAEHPMGACIVRTEQQDLVTLEQAAEIPQLQSLALAARELRKPLDGAVAIAEKIESKQEAAQMNRRLYQAMRILNNMSDAIDFAQAEAKQLEPVEIGIFLREILEKATSLLPGSGTQLHYELPDYPIFTLADPVKLERAVYNLLANAIKFATPDTPVQVKLVHKDKRLYFSVANCHDNPNALGNLFNRFLREPGLEDPKNGLGLGMVMIRAAAAIHGGAVLVDQTHNSIRITLSLQIQSSTSSQVRSPQLRFDYTGGRDHCLLELSEVLPLQHYHPDNIL